MIALLQALYGDDSESMSIAKVSIGLLLIALFLWHCIQSPAALPTTYFKKPVVVIGKVLGIPKHNKLGSRFLVAIKSIQGKKHHGKLQIAWYQHRKVVHPDENWRWLVKLKPVHGLHNPGGFNFERWAKQRGIIATGYVVQSHKIKLLQHSHFSIDAFREKLQRAIQQAIPSSTLSGVINALSIGSKDFVSPQVWLVFQRTGTSHLIAISGLHVGLVVAIAYFCMNWFLRCLPWLLLQWPAQRWAAIWSIGVAWGYGFLVGFSLPTQRAVIMMTALMLSTVFSRRFSIWQRLLFAFLVMIAFQPLSIFSASFWLSFMAVFWLAYAAYGKGRWLRVKLVLSLGLLPITLYCFHQVSFVALIANLIAIPWVTVCIVPLCLLASVVFLYSKTLALGIWQLAAKSLHPLWSCLSYLSHWNPWLHPVNDFFIMLAALMGVLLLVAPRGLSLRLLAVALMLPLFFYYPARPKNNVVWLTVLDVGQGLAVVLQTAHHVLVYDAGPRLPTGFDAGRSVLMPFLQRRGIQKIDRLMISHGDNDHIGGSFWLVKHYPIDAIVSSISKSRWHRRFQHCYAGQAWWWDGVKFQVLWPPRNERYQDNDSSCVLQVRAGGRTALLTGDIEKSVEQALVAGDAHLSSDILIAPHHGSRSSSTAAFVAAVHPKTVLVSAGYRNRYHFPAQSVLKRYRAVGAQIFSTSRWGALSVALGISDRISDNERLNKIRLFHESVD